LSAQGVEIVGRLAEIRNKRAFSLVAHRRLRIEPRAERHANAELPAPLRHEVSLGAVQADDREHDAEPANVASNTAYDRGVVIELAPTWAC
jgi:hypothetical protein